MIKKVLVFLATLLLINSAYANPEGGVVAAGSATITSPNASTVQINQASDKAIINWQSFNISSDETTRFVQPNAGSVALNRIDPQQGASQIFGHIQANGQIILVNQAGIYFGSGSRVDVTGIIASTSDITNENFLAGYYSFDQKSSLYNGSIINKGTIIAADHGLVALLGSAISNEGLVQAQLGNVVLASGNKFTVGFDNTGMINFTVDEATATAGVDQNSTILKNAVSNRGIIIADGGTILMAAKSVQGVMDRVINMEGVTQARSVQEKNGVIIFAGDNQGVTYVSGTVDASGIQSGETGGVVQVLGNYIHLDGSAKINVSGDLEGGEIYIGGSYQGKGPLQNASTTYVAYDVNLHADAITNGNGGKIIAWADIATGFDGTLSAQGGQYSGNGGFAEVSGKEYLNVDNLRINLAAPMGNAGTLLLDPSDVSLTTGIADSGVNFAAGTYTPTNNTTSNIQIDGATGINTRLASGNIIILATQTAGGNAGAITVVNPISWNSANSLTLTASHNILVNASITNAGSGGLTMTSGNSVSINSTITTGGTININATNSITVSSPISTTGSGNISLTSGGGAFNMVNINNQINTTSGTVTLAGNETNIGSNITTTGGSILFNNPVTLTGDTSLNAAGGNITFSNTVSGLGALVTSTSGAGVTTFNNALTGVDSLSVTGSTAINTSTMEASTSLSFGGNVTLGANTTIQSYEAVGVSFGGTVNGAQTLTLQSSGDVSFGDVIGGITPLTSLTIGGGFTTALNTSAITTTGAQNYNSAVTLGSNITLNTTNNAVNFASSITNSITPRTLTINTGSAALTLGGSVGAGTALGAITLNSTGTTTLSGTINAASLTTNAVGTTAINGGTVTTTGAQTYNDDVTAGAPLTLTTPAITLANTLNAGANNLIIASNLMTFNGAASSISGTGTITLAPSTTNGTIGVNTAGNLTLVAAQVTKLNSTFSSLSLGLPGSTGAFALGSSASMPIAVTTINAGTITGTSGNPFIVTGTLNLRSTGGTIGAAGANSFGITAPNFSVTTTANNNAFISSSVGTNFSSASTVGSGTLTLTSIGGIVTQSAAGTITAGRLVVGGTNAINLNSASNAITNLGVIIAPGGFNLTNGNNPITVVGTITTSAGNGAVSINTGTGLYTQNNPFIITSGSGAITITADSINLLTVANAFTTTSALTLKPSTVSTAMSLGTSGAGFELTAAEVTALAGGVTGAGTISIGDAAASTGILNVGGAVNFGAKVVTLNAGSYTNPASSVVTATTLNLLARNSGGAIATNANPFGLSATNLSVNTTGNGNAFLTSANGINFGASASSLGTGTLTYTATGGAGGAFTQSGSITGALVINAASGITLNGGITTTASQTYNNAVTLGADIAFNTTNSLVNFVSTIDNVTSRTLTVNAGSGAITLGNNVGTGTALGAITLNSTGSTTISGTANAASLTTDTNGTTTLNGASVTTSGAQNYNDTVTLGANTALTGAGITLSTVTGGARSLTLSDSATSILNGAITGLTTLLTNAVTFNNGNVSSTGSQTYHGIATLGASTVLTSNASDITLNNSLIGGAQSLTLTGGAGGNHVFTLNNITSLGTLTVNGNSSVTNTLALLTNSGTNTWTIASANTGTLAATNVTSGGFNNIQTLAGGSATNNFVFNDGATIDGSILGGGVGSNNTLNFSAYSTAVSIDAAGTSTGLGGTFSGLNNFIGGAGSNTFMNTAGSNTWNISNNNVGSIAGKNFNAFGSLVGGSSDTFIFGNNSAAISGNLTGGGNATLDVSALTSPTVNLQTQTSNGIGGTFSGISHFTGSGVSSSLVGTDNTTWHINSHDGGTVGSNTFSGFGNLMESSGNNEFIFDSGGDIDGAIVGGSGTNTLTIAAGNTNWLINAANSGNVTGIGGGFSNIQNLTGSSTGTNTFTFTGSGAVTGLINGGNTTQMNTVDYSGSTQPITLTLSAPTSGNEFNSGEINNSIITDPFTNIQQIIGNSLTQNYIVLPNKPNITVVFTNAARTAGYIGDPFYFTNFTLIGFTPEPTPVPPQTIPNDIAQIITPFTQTPPIINDVPTITPVIQQNIDQIIDQETTLDTKIADSLAVGCYQVQN